MTDVVMTPLYFELLKQIERMSAADLALPGLPSEASRSLLEQQLGRLPRSMADREVIGEISYVRNGFIHGWAISPTGRGKTLTVEVVKDGRVLSQALANEPISQKLLPRDARRLNVDMGFVLRAFSADVRAPLENLTIRVAEPDAVLGQNVTVYPPSYSIRRTPFEGFVEENLDGIVRGWVWSPLNPGQHFTVAIFVDGKPVGKTLANQFRGDLEASGFSGGYYAFSFSLDPDHLNGTERSVEVVLAENGVSIIDAPMLLQGHRLSRVQPNYWRRLHQYVARIAGRRVVPADKPIAE